MTQEPRPARLESLGGSKLSRDGDEVELRGKTVLDEAGEAIGTVEAVFADSDQHPRFIQVHDGGLLGLGGTSTWIPVEAIARVDEDVHLQHPRSTIAGAPRHDPEIDDQPQWAAYYEYYGYVPYFAPVVGAGAIFPRIPE